MCRCLAHMLCRCQVYLIPGLWRTVSAPGCALNRERFGVQSGWLGGFLQGRVRLGRRANSPPAPECLRASAGPRIPRKVSQPKKQPVVQAHRGGALFFGTMFLIQPSCPSPPFEQRRSQTQGNTRYWGRLAQQLGEASNATYCFNFSGSLTGSWPFEQPPPLRGLRHCQWRQHCAQRHQGRLTAFPSLSQPAQCCTYLLAFLPSTLNDTLSVWRN